MTPVTLPVSTLYLKVMMKLDQLQVSYLFKDYLCSVVFDESKIRFLYAWFIYLDYLLVLTQIVALQQCLFLGSIQLPFLLPLYHYHLQTPPLYHFHKERSIHQS